MGHTKWKPKGMYKAPNVTKKGWDGELSPYRNTRQFLKRLLRKEIKELDACSIYPK